MCKATMQKLTLIIACVSVAGCTSQQLRHSTLAQAQTLTDLEYTMVLDNIAMFRDMPGALPWHLKITQGSITINDTVNPIFNYTWGKSLSRNPSISAKRGWQDAWTIVPEIDVGVLTKLQDVYSRYANTNWIHSGPAPVGSISGRYGVQMVWVGNADVDKLTDLTTNVLGIAPITVQERGVVE
jgi:hypothetical protein